MATISYTFVSRCPGGCHVTLDVSFNGGQARRITYDIDTLRVSLSELTIDEREALALLNLRIHIAGKTRPQIATEFGSPVVITI